MLLSALAPYAHALPTRGLWVQFERRGWPVEYWSGQVVQQFTLFDNVVGSKVSDEVALQLDVMRGLGVNTITFELRTADPMAMPFQFPTCNIPPVLGFQWPQPTPTELGNLTLFLDLVHSKGIRVILVLTNTHMEEQLPTNSQAWLGAILGVVKNHPALDFVVFNGDAHVIDTNGDGVPDSCGGQAETPLWLGPTAVPATYVKWAIGYAMSLGLPASKLSAGTIVGDFFTDSQPPAGPDATNSHLWSPIVVLKAIFDSLGISDSQRVYALSFYEHRKCATARFLPCVDAEPPAWADQTMQGVFSTIGQGNGARVVAYEMGNSPPVDPAWSTASALANLVTVMQKYGADGGSFWRWTSFSNSEDADVTLAEPIKRRGVAFTFNPVQTTLVQAYTSQSPPPTITDEFASGISRRLRRRRQDRHRRLQPLHRHVVYHQLRHLHRDSAAVGRSRRHPRPRRLRRRWQGRYHRLPAVQRHVVHHPVKQWSRPRAAVGRRRRHPDARGLRRRPQD